MASTLHVVAQQAPLAEPGTTATKPPDAPAVPVGELEKPLRRGGRVAKDRCLQKILPGLLQIHPPTHFFYPCPWIARPHTSTCMYIEDFAFSALLLKSLSNCALSIRS